MNKDNKKLVKIVKDNNLIQGKYHLNPLEQKFIYKLIEYIQANNFIEREVELTFENFLKGFKQVINKRITKQEFKNFIEGIQDKRIILYSEREKFIRTQWFKISGDLNYNTLTLEIDKDVFNYIHNLHTKFTELSLESLYKFKKFYSMRIYELLKQWSCKGETKIIGFELNYLREILGLKDKKAYETFANFRARILEPTKEEINNNSELIIDYNFKTEHKKIVGIYFEVFDSGIEKKKIKEDIPFFVSSKKEQKNNNGNLCLGIEKDNNNKHTFNNFDQRIYDYDSLEKKLLGWNE